MSSEEKGKEISASESKKVEKNKNKKGNSKKVELKELPDIVTFRINLFDEIEKKREAELQVKKEKIEVKLPDGKAIEGTSWETTPFSIAQDISKNLAKAALVALVDGKKWDLHRPLESSCTLEICDFKSEVGKDTFWHSSAHVLGQSLEHGFSAKLCIGPPIEEGGFYYDCDIGERTVTPEDYDYLQAYIDKLTADKHPFKRLELTKQEALEMFKENPFKVEILSAIPDDEATTVYRCGPLIDLCRGPHVPNTGYVKNLSIIKHSAAYWRGNSDNASLQRVYGISFPDKKQLKEYKHFLKLAAERDHRKIGMDQQLFFFNDVSPGSCFFLPHGTRIYNKLIQFIRSEYRKRGFEEVVSPNVFSSDLWKTSGHYQHYKENIFMFESEKKEFGLKPMNCPGHCVMFKSSIRSYRDLPIRFADFGVLHRNEASGALTGLTRVRRFQQDDAHIFCRKDQIEKEIDGCLDFLNFVYKKLNFTFSLALSTRPKKYMGEIEDWEKAEAALTSCLERFTKANDMEWKLNPEDGAFYGPKIDIQLTDALRRKHQCATIQLDFQLPKNFDLQFKADAGFERPVIVHRAILGSVERLFGVLVEHCGGKWPFWLSPRQAIVIPVSPVFIDYAREVRDMIFDKGFYCDVDDGRNQLKKKIRDAQIAQYNFILVVGEEEMNSKTVNIRTRKLDRPGTKSIPELLDHFNDILEKYE